jgi:acyl transferase domain-containing protein
LRDNECDLAIVAGVRIGLSGRYYEGAIAMQAISPSGRCRPFGEGADGMVPGEGCGVLVLERPAKARAAGRRVRALVAGTAVLHQGRSPGLATPVAAAQAAVIRSALADSRIDASKIDYIEGHGTGTALGDPIEIEGLAKVFSSERRRQLGSVKSNIGHLEPAAGIASLIKVVLALENRRIPPSLHAHPTNRLIDLDSLGFEVPQSRHLVGQHGRQFEAGKAGAEYEHGLHRISIPLGLGSRSPDPALQSRRSLARALRSGPRGVGVSLHPRKEGFGPPLMRRTPAVLLD